MSKLLVQSRCYVLVGTLKTDAREWWADTKTAKPIVDKLIPLSIVDRVDKIFVWHRQTKILIHGENKTFLPMVIKKSPLETLHMTETHPTVSSKLDLPLKKEALEKETPTDKECHKEGSSKILVQKKVSGFKNHWVKNCQERTLLQAFMMDVMQAQGWLTRLLARGHMWLFRQELGLVRGFAQGPTPSPTMLILESRPRVKEEEPNSILPEHLKTKPMKQRHPGNYTLKKDEVKSQENSNTKSSHIKSNFVDTLVERAPEWQKSLSARLGAVQKKIVDKLPK